MSKIDIDKEFIERFEAGLNARHPDKSAIPATVLGYGEMSTVLAIQDKRAEHLAFKRMPMFHSRREVEDYEEILYESLGVLRTKIGVQVAPTGTTWLEDKNNGLITIYIAQPKLAADSICNSLIAHLPAHEVKALVRRVLAETHKVFDYNAKHRGETEIGFDAQISNWAVADYRPGMPFVDGEFNLLYIDISSPLMRTDGKERLDSELFLRSAPSFLRWLIRLLFVQDVINRYYDQRKVTIDLLANFYKEQRADLIPAMIDVVNEFYADALTDEKFAMIHLKEVKSYYREDAMIWRIYLAARKIDRFLHRLFGKRYPYMLPDKIKR